MEISVNGEKKNVAPDLNVHQLLNELKLNPDETGIAVAVGEEVVSRSRWKQVVLQPGTAVEVIRAVGGGGKLERRKRGKGVE